MDEMHVLIGLSGLPGVGKSTIARALADEFRICLLELDRIETPLLRQGIDGDLLGWGTYEALNALAEQQLMRGIGVILDAVTWWDRIRAEWAELARRTGARYRPIEVVCSDASVHQARVDARHREDATNPTWEQVLQSRVSYWEEWNDGDRLVVDTADPTPDLIESVLAYVVRSSQGRAGRI